MSRISYAEIEGATDELARRARQSGMNTQQAAADMGFDPEALVDASISYSPGVHNSPQAAFVLGALIGFILGVKDASEMVEGLNDA